MVTKSKAGQKKGKVKVGKLKLNKETVQNLNTREKEQVKGGVATPAQTSCIGDCGYKAPR